MIKTFTFCVCRSSLNTLMRAIEMLVPPSVDSRRDTLRIVNLRTRYDFLVRQYTRAL
ncbi:hypothetical protein DPMN_011204 [Dreissena polymorpha]|uniref:Uncharacterized protein n=1 Tax=Dreissena polymorpha TaxID=45954 RepID=A0A9D4S1P7_DREPO|nr:hypothetical protein DPMN_011204 [Dreissena polymorpha]